MLPPRHCQPTTITAVLDERHVGGHWRVVAGHPAPLSGSVERVVVGEQWMVVAVQS